MRGGLGRRVLASVAGYGSALGTAARYTGAIGVAAACAGALGWVAGCTGVIGSGPGGSQTQQSSPGGSPPGGSGSMIATSSGAPAGGSTGANATTGAGGSGPGTSGAVGSGPGGSGPGATTPTNCASAPLATGSAYIRRLTTWEYANTVSDVLGVPPTTAITSLLPADIHANGFSNDYGGQLASLDSATAYQQTADAIGGVLSAKAGWLTPFATCNQTIPTCRDSIVGGLGLRLFRRPVTQAEATSFGALFDTAVADGMTTASSAAIVVVRAMLQSPQFLYRLETQLPPSAGATVRPLDNYEIASRLSYLIWSSAPDPALLTAAQMGQLTTPTGLAAQVTRMIALAPARVVAQRYFREWLFLDGLDEENRGPTFTLPLAAAMRQETLDDVGDQLWDKGQPLLSMFTSQTTIVTPIMQTYYKLGPAGPDGRWSTANLPGRVGFLTHAGVLTMNGAANASIVMRGLFMLRNVLCQDVPAPPPGATSVMLTAATASQRQMSDARLKTQPCLSCHGQFDPLAYAFEPFDNMGAWQTMDVNGNAVRQDGWITVPGSPNVPYMTVADYMPTLIQDSRVTACMQSRITQFAFGRPMSTDDACMLQDIATRVGSPQAMTFAGMVTAVAKSPYFVNTSVQ